MRMKPPSGSRVPFGGEDDYRRTDFRAWPSPPTVRWFWRCTVTVARPFRILTGFLDTSYVVCETYGRAAAVSISVDQGFGNACHRLDDRRQGRALGNQAEQGHAGEQRQIG